jgi:hypothetical protein
MPVHNFRLCVSECLGVPITYSFNAIVNGMQMLVAQASIRIEPIVKLKF